MKARAIALPRLPLSAARAKHIAKWSLIHVAMVLFFADLVALIWPAFGSVWSGPIQKMGVALAAFFACIAEYLYDDEELKRHISSDDDA